MQMLEAQNGISLPQQLYRSVPKRYRRSRIDIRWHSRITGSSYSKEITITRLEADLMISLQFAYSHILSDLTSVRSSIPQNDRNQSNRNERYRIHVLFDNNWLISYFGLVSITNKTYRSCFQRVRLLHSLFLRRMVRIGHQPHHTDTTDPQTRLLRAHRCMV